MEFTLKELSEHVGGELYGDGHIVIRSVATLQNAQAGSISFLSNRSYRKYLPQTQASAVILDTTHSEYCPVATIVVDNPYLAYARVASLLFPTPTFQPQIHSTAVVSENAFIHKGAYIGPNVVIESGASIESGCIIGPGCVVGADTKIGEQTRLVTNVSILHGCTIGKRTLLHPGVVIGADGFGLAQDQGIWEKVPQLGGVVIGDDVEIGANTTVDRGALADTVIEDGVKLDNQIQVAHNVHIGAHTAIAGCTGIAGSTHIGKHCAIAGGVGVVGHLEITDHVHITGMSLVTKSIKSPGVYASGVPLQEHAKWRHNFNQLRHLNEMAKKIKQLESKIEQIQK